VVAATVLGDSLSLYRIQRAGGLWRSLPICAEWRGPMPFVEKGYVSRRPLPPVSQADFLARIRAALSLPKGRVLE
jgi:hypothetical protein